MYCLFQKCYILFLLDFAANAPPHEISSFWEELQLMKNMVPHGNLVNLLGYCTTGIAIVTILTQIESIYWATAPQV